MSARWLRLSRTTSATRASCTIGPASPALLGRAVEAKEKEVLQSELNLLRAQSVAIIQGALTGLALGLVEGLTTVFYPEASSIVVFVIMAIVLMIRPQGLFAVKVRR